MIPLFGRVILRESPYAFPFDPVGSPTKVTFVYFSIASTNICAAEKVAGPMTAKRRPLQSMLTDWIMARTSGATSVPLPPRFRRRSKTTFSGFVAVISSA